METLNAEGDASGTWKDWRLRVAGVNHGGAWFDLDNNPSNGIELILQEERRSKNESTEI